MLDNIMNVWFLAHVFIIQFPMKLLLKFMSNSHGTKEKFANRFKIILKLKHSTINKNCRKLSNKMMCKLMNI